MKALRFLLFLCWELLKGIGIAIALPFMLGLLPIFSLLVWLIDLWEEFNIKETWRTCDK